jgi:hypothetical protein
MIDTDDGGVHDLGSLIDEFDPPADEHPEAELAVLPKVVRRRKPRRIESHPQGHIHLCPCSSCLAARPERASVIASRKKTKEIRAGKHA